MLGLTIGFLLSVIIFVLPVFLLLIIKRPAGNRFGYQPASMGMGQAIQVCLKKYVDFNGRASRSEFWWFYLFVLLVNIVAILLASLTGIGVFGAATYAFIVPGLAVGARRLHDINRSGWWQLLSFGLGVFALIYLWAQPSQNGLEEKATVFD